MGALFLDLHLSNQLTVQIDTLFISGIPFKMLVDEYLFTTESFLNILRGKCPTLRKY